MTTFKEPRTLEEEVNEMLKKSKKCRQDDGEQITKEYFKSLQIT